MIFRRKKTAAPGAGNPAVMRSRENAGDERGRDKNKPDNPLARRLHPEDEPDTIDLEEPARFHSRAAAEVAEPDTREIGNNTENPASAEIPGSFGSHRVLTQDHSSGKFYVHPGDETYLGTEAVQAPTELRPGDKIRIGDFEFHFLPKP